MNEFSPIASSPERCSSPLLTPEEEAALLAEYGVRGPCDDLLGILAVSRFRSHYGDTNVFLTGNPNLDLTGEPDDIADEFGQPSEDEILHDPIDLLAYRYSFSFGHKAPTSLVRNITDTLAELEGRPAHSHHSSLLALPLDEIPESTYFPEDTVGVSGTHSLLDDADRLLKEVDECFQTPIHIDHHTDPYFWILQDELARDEELIPAMEFDEGVEKNMFPSESECYDLLESSKALRRRMKAWKRPNSAAPLTINMEFDEPLNVPESGEKESCEKEVYAANEALSDPPTPREPSLPRLFAFEVGCTLEQAEAQKQWDNLLQQCESRNNENVRSSSVVEVEKENPLPLSLHEEEFLSRHSLADLLLTSAELPGEGGAAVVASTSPPTGPVLSESADASFAFEENGGERNEGGLSLRVDKDEERYILRQEERGELVMGNFAKLLDRLFPPIPEERVLLESNIAKGASPALVEANGEWTSISSIPSLSSLRAEETTGTSEWENADKDDIDIRSREEPNRNALSRIQRQARLESMLIQREAAEARQMRKEDARIERFLLETRFAETRIKEEKMNQCIFEPYEKQRDAIQRDEEFSAKELCRLYQNSLQAIFAKIEERKKSELTQPSGQISAELKAPQEQIKVSHEEEFVELARNKSKDLLATQEHIQSSLEKEPDKSIHAASPSPPGPSDAANPTLSTFFSASALEEVENLRVEALLKEYEARVRWVRLRSTEFTSLIGRMQGEVNVRRRELCKSGIPASSRTRDFNMLLSESATPKAVFPPPSPSPASSFSSLPSSSHLSRSLVVLDSDMFRQTQAALFLNLREAGMEASRRFHALSFSLENIQTVDWKSLHSVRSNSNNTGSSVCAWVRDLDIGSNALEGVALSDLITAFPSLRRVNLSDNQITTLDHERHLGRVSSASLSIRSVASAQQNAISERTKLSDLNISSNSLKDLDAVRKFLSHSITRLCVYTNQLRSIEPLRSCIRLTKLELNRNALSDTEPLESLSFLQVLNLCDNQITQIDALSKGSWPLLEKLYLSNNALTSLLSPQAGNCKTMEDAHCLCLSQLFVNYNRFTAFSEKELPWMPMLSVLQAEGNQLQDISGLVRCPRLVILKLPFNQLGSLSSLKILGVCRLLANMDLRANPLLTFLNPTRGECVDSDGLNPDNSPRAGETHSTIALFRRIFPRLSELNNESYPLLLSDISSDPQAETLVDLNDRENSAHLGQALAADKFIIDLRARREALFVVHRRRFHHATTLEKNIHKKGKKCHHPANIPTRDLSSLTVEDEQQLETFEFLQKILETFIESVDSAFAGDYNGLLRQVPEAGSANAKELRESEARNRLAWWMVTLVLRRRAVHEVEKRRKAAKEKEEKEKAEKEREERERARRHEAAARRIQPVWRGAVLRSRLKRIFHASQKELEDEKDFFTKVELPNLLEEYDTGGDDIGGIIRRAVRDEVSFLPRFEVDWSRLQNEGGSSSAPGTAETRPRGALNIANLAMSDNAMTRPRTSSPPEDHGEPTTTKKEGGGSEWDASVAFRIQKKRKKMQRVHQQHLSEEFMRDPLKFKQKMHQGATKKH